MEVSLNMESVPSLGGTMFTFELFQCGLIFTALLAGVVSICHVIYCRAIICSSSSLLLVLILTGICNLLVCVYLLHISQNSALHEIPRGGNQQCTDYNLPATLANAVILAAIVHNIIRENITASFLAYLVWTVSIGSIVTGLFSVAWLSDLDPPTLHQETFIRLGSANETHIDVFWSVCQKDIFAEKFRLLVEYGLIYLPVLVIVMFAWNKSFRDSKDMSFQKIRIVDRNCCSSDIGLCVCSRLGTVFVAILAYSTLILLIVRPAMIVYALATSGYFRDILPSLLHTVMYCFICTEYLSKAFCMNQAQYTIARSKKRCSKMVLYV